MVFLPYKMDSRKKGLPLFTVLICLICIWVYWEQYSTDNRHYQAIHNFCTFQIDRHADSILQNVEGYSSGGQCYQVFEAIRESENPQSKILVLAENAKPIGLFATPEDDTEYTYQQLQESYHKYDVNVPKALTDELVYDPKDMDLVKMVTSTFSHGDIFHLLGNLLFFYIFAASVELIVGNIVFALFIMITTFGTSLANSYSMAGVENALPTLGLSGVVMAAVAALAVMMPHAQIRCVLWLLFIFKIIRLPALFLAAWFIGWDLYDMNASGGQSNVNYIAHVSGAFIGAIVGIYYFVFEKHTLRVAAEHY